MLEGALTGKRRHAAARKACPRGPALRRQAFPSQLRFVIHYVEACLPACMLTVQAASLLCMACGDELPVIDAACGCCMVFAPFVVACGDIACA